MDRQASHPLVPSVSKSGSANRTTDSANGSVLRRLRMAANSTAPAGFFPAENLQLNIS